MGSNCCKGDAARPVRSSSSIYSRSRAGATLDERFTVTDDAGGVRLTVSTAKTGDSGVYTLQASNAAGSDTSRVRLEVSAEETPTGEDPPTFLRRLQDLTVKVGTRTRFLVEIISSTECKVTWYRNERRLMEAERVALARDGNFWCADVAAISVDDAGRWTCTAENEGGRASCSAHLNVLVPKAYKRPEFVEELRALLTEQGTVSLECKVVGVPTPVLRWFKDSREIKAGDVFALTANADDPTSLGTYTCEAVNCMGRAYSSSKVHVVGRTGESSKPNSSAMSPEPPPIFTKELEDHSLKICDVLTLSCHIVVPPWPRSVVWYNKEGKVEPGDRYHVSEDGVGGYLLEVPSAEWADEGEWKCVATSAGGRVGITTCYVAMEVPKNYRKPRFMENLQAVLTEEGLVSFECKVVGFPTPILSWFKDGQELKPGDVYQLTGTNSLGSYCCIARNCMGQASSSAELTVEDIQNQLNEEEKLQLFSKNQAPRFIQGLKSVEAKIDEPFRFTVKVAIPPEPSVLWYRDEQPVDEGVRCHLNKEERGGFSLDLQNLEFLDQAEWKCVAINDFGHSVTSCFLKLIIPRHYKKPRFLENLQAILSEEGAVNLECKVIGVPQPVLKWYKDGEELKPGDIHRIISGQDGTCCLGTYTCEAQNCMGIAASSASLLGFEESMKAKAKKAEEQALQRNLSLSTIHEERTSQMYDTPVGDITLDDKGEISFSFDGKEVSVSLYETPDLTEEEALQIVEMYADQLSENVTEHNVVELPPLRFVKETSTSGNLLMEAIIIDVSPDHFASLEEDLRTEADVEDISIADENGPPQLSLDQDIDIGGEDYLEKTMALLSEEKSDIPARLSRKKSDSQKSVDDFYSLSHDQSLSEGKRDDDTHISESDQQSYASARSSAKIKSRSSKPSLVEGLESSEPTKTILHKDEVAQLVTEDSLPQPEPLKPELLEVEPTVKQKRERRTSRGSRRSSSGSEKSYTKSREELLRLKAEIEQLPKKPTMSDDDFITKMAIVSDSLTKIINDVQLIERDIILKSELMSSAATASRSLEIIGSLISPLSEIHSIADAAKESVAESREVSSTIFNNLPQPLKALHQSLTIVEKCIDMESDNKTLVKKTCVAFIETCGVEVQKVISEITSITDKDYLQIETKVVNEIDSMASEMNSVIKFSADTIKACNLLSEASEDNSKEPTLEENHLRNTQKAVFELKSPVNSLLHIVENSERGNTIKVERIKNSDVLLNEMSSSIQDLQMALEQIEYLSINESNSALQKYNTEVIEDVVEPILKLRSSFELLSTETSTEEDKAMLKQVLSSVKDNLSAVSSCIESIETKIGCFDVLQSDNKLNVLQKMAQSLISLENNLPRLEMMSELQSNMNAFHKNLTKVLEIVIESNDAKKYFTLMEICDAVNRINSSIKAVDPENTLPLVNLSNTLQIIQNEFVNNVFEPELNCSIISNVTDVLVGIEEAINKAEELSLQIDSEHIQERTTSLPSLAKVNVIIEHIDHTIAAINTVKTIETTQDLKSTLSPTIENICPILVELKKSVAAIRQSEGEQEEHLSDFSVASFAQTLAIPLCELNQNIIVLNQILVENIESLKVNNDVMTAVAEPLHELHSTLEILQQDVISQYGDDLTPFEAHMNIASAVQNIHSCIIMIQEQAGIEATDEISTLEDISNIKTSADTLPSDRLVLPIAEETELVQTLPSLVEKLPASATAQALQSLNEHLTVLQTPEVIDAIDTLSDMSDYSSLKSVVMGIEELHNGIESILHPVLMESSNDLTNLPNVASLTMIAQPLQELQQSLSVLDTTNIPIYEDILDLPTDKVYSVIQSIAKFKEQLDKCSKAVVPAVDVLTNTLEISSKINILREVCEHLKDVIDSAPTDVSTRIKDLEEVVDNLLEVTDVAKGIKVNQIKLKTAELFEKVVNVQEDIIQFTSQPSEKLAQEAKLIKIVGEVENNIAVLQQYDFVDLSHASDMSSCVSPQLALEIESESLMLIDDIAENAVNIVQDSNQKTSIADLMTVEDFFKTCKNEFTILRYLINKAKSHKKVIRLIEEFKSLQSTVNYFKTKSFNLQLSDDVNSCLATFLVHTDDCVEKVKSSLIKIVESQSEMLIRTPLIKLESTQCLKEIAQSHKDKTMANIIEHFVTLVEISKPLMTNIQMNIIEELNQPSNIIMEPAEKVICEKLEEFADFVEDLYKVMSNDNTNKQILLNVSNCIKNHYDLKDASSKGKTLILLKILSECSDILQQKVQEQKYNFEVTKEGKETTLTEVLTEMLKPLQALQNQLVDIREQIISGVEEDSISFDITSTESLVQTMTELHKDIVQQIESEKSPVNEENISLIVEVDKEIHIIQDSIKSMENVSAAQAVKELTQPMQDIEKSLHDVLTSDTEFQSKQCISKGQAEHLLQHIDQYIELIEIVEEISAVIKVEDVKETLDIAKELKEVIAVNQATLKDEQAIEMNNKIHTEQARLATKLQKALSALQVQVFDNAQELATFSTDVLQRIAQVTAQLQADLVAVTGVNVAIQAPLLLPEVADFNKDIESLAMRVTTIEELVPEKSETIVLDQIEVMDETVSNKEHVLITTDNLETVTAVDQKPVLVEQEILTENIALEVDKGLCVTEKDSETVKKQAASTESNELIETSIHKSTTVSTEKNHEQAIKEKLVKAIDVFISGEVLQVVNILSPVINCEELNASIVTAKELRENIAAVKPSADLGTLDESQISMRLSKLSQQLQNAVLVLQENSVEHLQEVVPSVNTESLLNVTEISENLRLDLIAFINETDIVKALEIIEPIPSMKATTSQESVPTKEEEHLKSLQQSDKSSINAEYSIQEITGEQEVITYANPVETFCTESNPTSSVELSLITVTENESSIIKINKERATSQCSEKTVGDTQLPVKEDEMVRNIISDEKFESVKAKPEFVTDSANDNIATELVTIIESAEHGLTESMEQKTSESLITATGPLKLVQHIDKFITDEVSEILEEISTLANADTLKESLSIAKELREYIMATDNTAAAESTAKISPNILADEVQLKLKLHNALSILHTEALESAGAVSSTIQPEALQKVSEIITQLQEDIATSVDSSLYGTIHSGIQDVVEQNAMIQLVTLLQDVNDAINASSTENNADASETLNNTLDEVHTVIIKLKSDFDGAANDTLNETLDDLECSVRSVQLQINEDSPPELLKEACETLQLLANNINFTQEVNVSKIITQTVSTNVLEECANETNETLKLLEVASKIEPKSNTNLSSIISNLSSLTECLKTLRQSFLSDADTLIENGVEVIQCLSKLEDQVFALEKDVDSETALQLTARDTIITAVHSVYGSISNMRSTISSIQKRYMFENYGQPSESLLLAIKNVSTILCANNDFNKSELKKFSKSIRKVLNHFEDIKFYINLDKTARLPSDATFTKIILDELKMNISNALLPDGIILVPNVLSKVHHTLQCVEKNLNLIESNSNLEVKNKLPMFREIALEILSVTNALKLTLEDKSQSNDKPLPNEQTIEQEFVEEFHIPILESKIEGNDVILETATNEIAEIETKNDEVQFDCRSKIVEVSSGKTVTKPVDTSSSSKVTGKCVEELTSGIEADKAFFSSTIEDQIISPTSITESSADDMITQSIENVQSQSYDLSVEGSLNLQENSSSTELDQACSIINQEVIVSGLENEPNKNKDQNFIEEKQQIDCIPKNDIEVRFAEPSAINSEELTENTDIKRDISTNINDDKLKPQSNTVEKAIEDTAEALEEKQKIYTDTKALRETVTTEKNESENEENMADEACKAMTDKEVSKIVKEHNDTPEMSILESTGKEEEPLMKIDKSDSVQIEKDAVEKVLVEKESGKKAADTEKVDIVEDKEALIANEAEIEKEFTEKGLIIKKAEATETAPYDIEESYRVQEEKELSKQASEKNEMKEMFQEEKGSDEKYFRVVQKQKEITTDETLNESETQNQDSNEKEPAAHVEKVIKEKKVYENIQTENDVAKNILQEKDAASSQAVQSTMTLKEKDKNDKAQKEEEAAEKDLEEKKITKIILKEKEEAIKQASQSEMAVKENKNASKAQEDELTAETALKETAENNLALREKEAIKDQLKKDLSEKVLKEKGMSEQAAQAGKTIKEKDKVSEKSLKETEDLAKQAAHADRVQKGKEPAEKVSPEIEPAEKEIAAAKTVLAKKEENDTNQKEKKADEKDSQEKTSMKTKEAEAKKALNEKGRPGKNQNQNEITEKMLKEEAAAQEAAEAELAPEQQKKADTTQKEAIGKVLQEKAKTQVTEAEKALKENEEANENEKETAEKALKDETAENILKEKEKVLKEEEAKNQVKSDENDRREKQKTNEPQKEKDVAEKAIENERIEADKSFNDKKEADKVKKEATENLQKYGAAETEDVEVNKALFIDAQNENENENTKIVLQEKRPVQIDTTNDKKALKDEGKDDQIQNESAAKFLKEIKESEKMAEETKKDLKEKEMAYENKIENESTEMAVKEKDAVEEKAAEAQKALIEKEETDEVVKTAAEKVLHDNKEAKQQETEAEKAPKEKHVAEKTQKEKEAAKKAFYERDATEKLQQEKEVAKNDVDKAKRKDKETPEKSQKEESAEKKLTTEAAQLKENAEAKILSVETENTLIETDTAKTALKGKEATDKALQEKETAKSQVVEVEKSFEEKDKADKAKIEKQVAEKALKEKEATDNLLQEKEAEIKEAEIKIRDKIKEKAKKVKKEKDAGKALKEEKSAQNILKEKKAATKRAEAENALNETKTSEKALEEKKATDKVLQEKETIKTQVAEAEMAIQEKDDANKSQKVDENVLIENATVKKGAEKSKTSLKEEKKIDKIQKEKETTEIVIKEEEAAQIILEEKKEAKTEAAEANNAFKEAEAAEKATQEIKSTDKVLQETETLKKQEAEAENTIQEKGEAEKSQRVNKSDKKALKEKEAAKKEAEKFKTVLNENEKTDKIQTEKETAKALKEEESAQNILKEKEEAKKQAAEAENALKEAEAAEKALREKVAIDQELQSKEQAAKAEKANQERDKIDKAQKLKEADKNALKEIEATEKLLQEQGALINETDKALKEKKKADKIKKDKEDAEKALEKEETAHALKKISVKQAAEAEKALKEKDEAHKAQLEKEAVEKTLQEKEAADKLLQELEAATNEAAKAKKALTEEEVANKIKIAKKATENALKEEIAENVLKEKEEAKSRKTDAENALKEKEAAEKSLKEKETTDFKALHEKEAAEAEKVIKEKEEAEKAQKEAAQKMLGEKEATEKLAQEKEAAKKAAGKAKKALKEKEKAEKNKKDQEAAEKAIKEEEASQKVLKEQEDANIQASEAKKAKEEDEANKVKKEKEAAVKVTTTKKRERDETATALKDKDKEDANYMLKEKQAADKLKTDDTDDKNNRVAVSISINENKDSDRAQKETDKIEEDKKAQKDKVTEVKENAIISITNDEKLNSKSKKTLKEKSSVKKCKDERDTIYDKSNETINLKQKDVNENITSKSHSNGTEIKREVSEKSYMPIDCDVHLKQENGNFGRYQIKDSYESQRTASNHDHYIKEYQYEPSPAGESQDLKEKPRFIDHNHRDYTLEFAHPPGYRERSFDIDRSENLSLHDQLGKNATIYKAQTIVLDAQLRSSTSPYPDISRINEPSPRRTETRPRSKALSEARSVISEKRSGISRDSKRKPVFSTYLTDRTAVEGSRVKLTCSVLSSTDPTVTWYKNGVLLDNKLKYRTKHIDGLITVEVLNAVPSDSAEYSCTVVNENGSVSSSANLKVYPSFEASPIPPTFTRSIRDTYHLAENELVLECRIRGQPLPTITWLKDDRSVGSNERFQAYYLADGVCRLAIESPTPEDSGKYTCKAENSVWTDQITHVVNFTGKESRLSPNIATIEKSRFNRQAMESRRPHFTNVLTDYKVAKGGTIGLQVEIRGAPTNVEWLREGRSVTEIYRNARTFVEQGLYTLALSDVTEKESGMYTCRAWSAHGNVDMNAAITVVQPNEMEGKPAIIVGRPEKDILISVGEDVNISFRVQGEPKPKVVFMKGIRDITTSQRVCKMTSDDYVKFTLKRSVVSDAGTYCILARNAYGCDRAFVTVVVRQRASSDQLISDWTYPVDDAAAATAERNYKSVPERIPGEPSAVDGGSNWVSLAWPKPEPGVSAPVLAFKVEAWLLGKDGGARWTELGITPLNSFDAFNLKQGEEYHFRVTPRNRYGWGESVQTSTPVGVGLTGDRPEFVDILPGQLKILAGETANLTCSVKGKPTPEVVWMKNGHEIEDESSRVATSFNGFNCSLVIKVIDIEDEARYSCEATNVHGRTSTYARLAVVTDRLIWEADAKLKRERSAGVEGDYPPQFTMRLRDRRVQATYPVRLTCQVVGSPAPDLTWFKDGLEVQSDNRHNKSQDEHFHTLEIAPTTLEDGGVYEAMARNSSGAVSCRCSLVVDKGIRAYVAPEFCCGLEPLYRLSDGEELRISAVVEAYPSVGVTWYRDGVRLRPSRRAVMTLDHDGQIELALAAVTPRDAGVYTCTASNEVGRAATSGKVEVIGGNDERRPPPVVLSPDVPYSKEPMFIRKPRSSEAREGDTVIIQCEVVGDPKPDVYWLRDFLKPDYYRDATHFRRVGLGPEYRFEIPHAKLDYTGAYSVVARNVHGEAKAIISLQILAKDPSSPEDAHNVRYGVVEVLPQFHKELTDLLSCDGDAVEFECRVSGHPEPDIRWFHYHDLIRDCEDFESTFEEGTARLKIRQVTAEDEGTYTCEAANCLGKAVSSACLVVYPPGEPNTLSQRLRRPPALLSAASTPRSTPRTTPARSVSRARTPGLDNRRLCSPARQQAPTFYTYPFNKVAEEGDTVSLQCAVKGLPAPWATWDKDGVILTPSSRITIKEKDEILRILEIEQVTIDDVGVYRITVENEFGRAEASARIEVITQKGKFYGGVRAISPSPRRSLTYRSRRPSTPRQD